MLWGKLKSAVLRLFLASNLAIFSRLKVGRTLLPYTYVVALIPRRPVLKARWFPPCAYFLVSEKIYLKVCVLGPYIKHRDSAFTVTTVCFFRIQPRSCSAEVCVTHCWESRRKLDVAAGKCSKCQSRRPLPRMVNEPWCRLHLVGGGPRWWQDDTVFHSFQLPNW